MNPSLKPYSLPYQHSCCCFQGLTAQPAYVAAEGETHRPPRPAGLTCWTTVTGVLRAAGYEIKSIDKDKGHVSATKGNVDFTLTFVDQVKPCAVRWTIDKSSRPQVQDTESTTMSCVGFRPELEKALGID